MQNHHIPVLLNETIESLNIKPDGVYVDATVGFGGHSSQILKRLGENGRLYCIDQDPDALKYSGELLGSDERVHFIKGNFSDILTLVRSCGVDKADGVLMDIGVSSYQLDNAERGFSFHADAPLDMRMSKEGPTAADMVNTLSKDELLRILYDYGEEKFAPKIVSAIIKRREISPITTTGELAEIVVNAYPPAKRRDGHPARQTFQALRIFLNKELDVLALGIDGAFELLGVGGVLSVITFHSLEDRLTKQSFQKFCTGCICPPDFPVCVCGRKPAAKKQFSKPVTATEEELNVNPRSRSAKLRSIVKLSDYIPVK